MDILITTVNGRPDKNDTLLQEFVHAKNWKQALVHCEKRLKKGEKNDKLLVGVFCIYCILSLGSNS